MDESFEDLEAELKSLQPRRPSAHLLEQLGADLPVEPMPAIAAPARARYTTSTNLSLWKWVGWRTAGLAAAAAILVTAGFVGLKRPALAADTPLAQVAANPSPVAQSNPVTESLRDHYQPVAAANVLYDLKYEGPARSADDTDARRLRYRYLDTYTWKNPKSNASLKWSVPRDEIRLVSATLN